MILELYVWLTFFSISILFLGYAFNNMLAKVIGYFIMIMFGFSMVASGIEITANTLINQTTYDSAFCSDPDSMTCSETSIAKIYTTQDARMLGILFIVIGLYGSTYLIHEENQQRKKIKEEQ
jgi:beta-lactamase regulating signal transducer with metallopeptidase domain